MPAVSRVLIAGGGIGGLALAIALRRKDIEPVVVERAPEYAEVGGGMVLSPNGMKALTALGENVAADVVASGAPFARTHTSHFLTHRGRVLGGASLGGAEDTWGAPTVPILRSRLQAVLLRHAAGIEIRTGHTATGFTDRGADVALELSGGAGPTGDLLVGADGVRSMVRHGLLADGEPRYTGYTAITGTAPTPRPWPGGFIAYGRGLILFAAPVGDDRVYWVATLRDTAGTWPAKEDQVAKQDLLTLVRRTGWHPDLIGVIAAADPGQTVRTDVTDRDPTDTWHRGRTVLIGDAAHPMAPTMGQGANTALEDAVVLAHRLGDHHALDDALTAFTGDRHRRVASIVKQSRMMGAVGHARNPLAAWARNRMMTLMTRFGDPGKQNADVFGWRPPA